MAGSVSNTGITPGGIEQPETPPASGTTSQPAGAPSTEGTIVRGGETTTPRDEVNTKLLEETLAAWKTDPTAASRITATALPEPGLVPAEKKLHVDIEKVLYQARGDIAVGTLMSREHFNQHVARNVPLVEAACKQATDLASKYHVRAMLETDPQRKEGLELRSQYYQALAVSVRARFNEIVEQNAGICDLRYGKAPDPKVVLDPLKKPVTGHGGKDWWNGVATDAMNELRKLDLRKEGEKGLKSAFDTVKGHFPPASEMPADVRADYEKAVNSFSSEMAKAVMSMPMTDKLANTLTEWMGSATRFIHAQATFARTEAKIREDVKERGGLAPGEDKAIDKAIAPVKQEVEAAKAELQKQQDKLKTSFYGGFGGVQLEWNPDILFVKNVSGKVGIQWAKKDFKARVFTDVRIDKPLSGDAVLNLHGRAELEAGKFKAGIYGKAKVEKLWTDPVFGPTAEVGFDMSYTDKTFKGTLNGKAILPIHDDTKTRLELNAMLKHGSFTYTAGGYANLPEWRLTEVGLNAGVSYKKGDFSIDAKGGMAFYPDKDPSFNATVGLTYRW